MDGARQLSHTQDVATKVAMVLRKRTTLAHEHFAERLRSAFDANVGTPQVVFTKKFADHTETERVPFADIAKIEHIFGGPHATFEVVAIGTDGTRYTIKESNDTTLIGSAEQMANIMKKPLEDIRKVQGFDPGTSSTTIAPKPDATTSSNP